MEKARSKLCTFLAIPKVIPFIASFPCRSNPLKITKFHKKLP